MGSESRLHGIKNKTLIPIEHCTPIAIGDLGFVRLTISIACSSFAAFAIAILFTTACSVIAAFCGCSYFCWCRLAARFLRSNVCFGAFFWFSYRRLAAGCRTGSMRLACWGADTRITAVALADFFAATGTILTTSNNCCCIGWSGWRCYQCEHDSSGRKNNWSSICWMKHGIEPFVVDWNR